MIFSMKLDPQAVGGSRPAVTLISHFLMWITISFRKTCLGYGRVPAGYVEIYRTSSQHLLKVQPHVVVIAFTFVFVCAVNNVVNIELQVHTYIHKRRTVSSWHTCHFETRQKKACRRKRCIHYSHNSSARV